MPYPSSAGLIRSFLAGVHERPYDAARGAAGPDPDSMNAATLELLILAKYMPELHGRPQSHVVHKLHLVRAGMGVIFLAH